MYVSALCLILTIVIGYSLLVLIMSLPKQKDIDYFMQKGLLAFRGLECNTPISLPAYNYLISNYEDVHYPTGGYTQLNMVSGINNGELLLPVLCKIGDTCWFIGLCKRGSTEP